MTTSITKNTKFKRAVFAALVPGLILWPLPARTNPSGGSVVHGAVEIDDSTPGHLRVNQASNRAIINWQDFSIGAGELTEFLQPGVDAVALNRVISGNPSVLMGTLRANGGLILVNQNGILVGGGGVVDIGGLGILSTLDIDDADFLDGGTMTFKGNSVAGVTNLGNITSRDGDVVLLGNFIDNQGTVGAPDGVVAFGAGGEFVVDTVGYSRISVVGPGPGGKKGITNSGTVNAAAVEFKAHGNVYAMAIENTGIVRANGFRREGGRIILRATGDGSVGGNITNSGTLQARNRDGSGGEIIVDAGIGGRIDNVDGRIDADGIGGADGGSITMLGDVINIVGNSRVSADGANGGAIQIGSREGTTAVTVGDGSSVSANGSAGDGGIIQILGAANSVLTIDGDVSANGTGAGGVISIIGGTVNQGVNSVISADGAVRGGLINISGAGAVNTLGAVRASGASSVGGQVFINGSAVNVSGEVEAFGATEGGLIRVDAESAAAVGGALDASAFNGTGGRIDASGETVNIGGSARIDASGAFGGGQVNLGGGIQGADDGVRNSQSTEIEEGASINVDALTIGDGGSVAVWSDGGTIFRGDISARALGSVGNGGFVEVSGQTDLLVGGWVSTAAANGTAGTFLIDPVDVTIGDGVGTIADDALIGFLGANNVIVHTAGAGAAAGNISIASGAKVIYDSPNSLTLLAHGNINVNGDIKNIGSTDLSNTGNITLVAGWGGTLPALPNGPGDPQTLSGTVSASDFINPDGTPIQDGAFGGWGALGSTVFLNDEGLEAVEVGSARGETNVFADVVSMQGGRSGGRFSQIGYRRVADSRANDAGQYGGFFADPDDQIVDGNINVSGLTAVVMRPSDEFNSSDLNKIRERAYTQIGHGGIRRADDNVDNVGGGAAAGYGYDSGVIAVADGDNSGDIVVYGGQALVMVANRLQSHAMVGHGGHGGGAPNSGNTPFTNSLIIGDMSGDIMVTAGTIEMEAGLYSDSPVQIGHGGYNVRGEHTGDIDVTSTIGGIIGTAAPNLGDAGPGNPTDWRWTNNRDRSWVQIGHGGVNSFHPDSLPNRTITLPTGSGTGNSSFAGDGVRINPDTGLPYGHRGDINVVSAGGVRMTATGNQAYAQIGHGGVNDRMENRGDITVEAQNGDIIFDRIAIQVDRNGMDRRNVGDAAYSQIGHGGYLGVGGAVGDIDVTATGDIEFHAGRNSAYAQIGHGGRGEDGSLWSGGRNRSANTANGTLSGDINVEAGGHIKFRSGFGTGGVAHSMIGHGGYRQNADILDDGSSTGFGADGVTEEFLIGGGASRILVDGNGDPILDGSGKFQLVADATQQGHNGNITVTAGGDIDFQAGQVEGEILPGQEPFGIENNRNNNFTMIGHGGYISWGDHWGEITLNAGEDVRVEARGGWDAVTIEGTNAGPADPLAVTNNLRGTPRFASTEDDGGTGVRNFGMIGHGGYDSEHRIHTTQNWNSSGKIAEGMGTLGPSDISITAGGDVILKAAQKATIGPELLLPATRQGGGSATTPVFYIDDFGVETALSAQFGDHAPRLNRVERANGDVWLMPDPVMASQDGFVQVGHGARSTGYDGGIDGMGHQANITINAGGGVTLMATDIKTSVAHNQYVEIQVHTGGVGAPTFVPDAVIRVGPAVGTTDPDAIGTVGGADGTDRRGQHNRSLYLYNYAQIGNGGWNARGDHLGDITITAGQDADGIGLLVRAGEGRESYAQVGNGGFDTDGYDPTGGRNSDNNRLGDIGSRGDIMINVVGDVVVQGGGIDGDATGEAGETTNAGAISTHDDDRYSYAQIGNGGAATGGSSTGDITVISEEGGLDVKAGNNARYGYAMLGHGGLGSRGEAHSGDITIRVSEDINVMGGAPFLDVEDTIGNGPSNLGQMSTTHIAYAQIGHGGWDSDPQGGNLNLAAGVGGHFGDMEIVSVNGSVILRGGGDPEFTRNDDTFFRGLSAQIGHGGNFTDGDHRGDLRVVAGQNVEVYGGAGGRDSYTMIGHGGHQVDGNLSGTIEVIAGNDLIMNRGADTDSSVGWERSGLEIFNNWAKIGHGDHRYRQRNSGAGNRNGDIFVSVGNDVVLSNPANRPFADEAFTRFLSDQTLIGHIDPINGGSSAFRSTEGDTFIGASRVDPFETGTGAFRVFEDAVITSAGGGFFGELRLYLPSPAQNFIMDDAFLNNNDYTRTPTPDGTRADELFATDHQQGVGVFGEPTAEFVPEGPYVPSGFGLYNIYYGTAEPILPPVEPPVLPPAIEEALPEEELVPIVVEPVFDVFPFLFVDKYDSFDRDESMLGGDSVFGLFSIFGLIANDSYENAGEETIRVEGDEILEESPGLFGLGPAQSEAERKEEEEKSGAYLRHDGGAYGRFWIYDMNTNEYSSFRVFGLPSTEIVR